MAEPRPTLLLVEDNRDDEQLTLRAIMNCGVDCTVDVVRHGSEVVGWLLSPGRAVPELVLLDYHLPGTSGLDVLRQLRRNPLTQRLPVVMLSGLATDREVLECAAAGASSCGEKPMDVLEYLDSVGAVVRYWLTIDQHPKPLTPIG